MADGGGFNIMSLAGLPIEAAKMIIGGVQAAKGRKQMNNLLANRPQYDISKGYMDYYKTAQQRAAGQMPGYDLMKGQIDQTTAKTRDYLAEGAMSSQQFMQGALSAQDKELQAIQNLGIQSAQWKDQQAQQLMRAQQTMGQQQDMQWEQNSNLPWNIQANMANERTQAGMSNLFGGMQNTVSQLQNYAGTNSMLQMYKKMYPQNATTQNPVGSSTTDFSNLLNPNIPLNGR